MLLGTSPSFLNAFSVLRCFAFFIYAAKDTRVKRMVDEMFVPAPHTPWNSMKGSSAHARISSSVFGGGGSGSGGCCDKERITSADEGGGDETIVVLSHAFYFGFLKEHDHACM